MLRLDIGDDASIKSFVRDLFKVVPQLDVLINNAG
jgi:NADP-dependent 3-hydroxy acid dehydrogenase YdfG